MKQHSRLKDYLTVQVTDEEDVLYFKNCTLLEKGEEGYDFPCYALFKDLKDSLIKLKDQARTDSDIVEFYIGYGESANLVCYEYLKDLTPSLIEEKVEDCLVFLDLSEE